MFLKPSVSLVRLILGAFLLFVFLTVIFCVLFIGFSYSNTMLVFTCFSCCLAIVLFFIFLICLKKLRTDKDLQLQENQSTAPSKNSY